MAKTQLKKIISSVLIFAFISACSPVSRADEVVKPSQDLLQQLTLFTMLDAEDRMSSFAKLTTLWFQKAAYKVLDDASIYDAGSFLEDIKKKFYSEAHGQDKLVYIGDARYGEVLLSNSLYTLRAYNPSIVSLNERYAGYRRVWEIRTSPYLAFELLQSGPRNFARLTGDQEAIVAGIRELAEKKVKCTLAGTDLAELSSPDIVSYLKAFCVVKDEALIKDLIHRRLNGEVSELFEAVFDPRSRLRDRRNEGKDPLRVVHVRGGRGAAEITGGWADLSREGLVDLTIIPGAVDDGRSWADMAFFMGATGVPDMGKCYANMGTCSEAVKFSEMRLIENVGPGSRVTGIRVLHAMIKAAEGKPNDDNDEDVERLLTAFRAMPKEKQAGALPLIKKFRDKILLEFRRKKHNININSIPMRSILILGAEEECGSWQAAIDVFGKFVDSAGKVVLPTEERLHAIAILDDGTILPTENAINEAAKEAEYIFFSVGPESAANRWVILSFFTGILGREPTRVESQYLELLRISEHGSLRNIFVKFLKDKTRDEKKKAISFIDRHFSYAAASPKIEVQISAIEAVENADVIAYGPTDIESNIASAVIYDEMSSAIRDNRKAAKFFISNARDAHGVEPIGTTTSSQLERLYRYLTDQQKYIEDECDFKKRPLSEVVDYALGRDERFRNTAIEDYIMFDEARIREMGALPVGLDLEMHTSGASREDDGKYSASLLIDAELSIFLMKDLGYPLETLDETLGTEKKTGEAVNAVPATAAEDGNALRREAKLEDLKNSTIPQLMNAMSVCGRTDDGYAAGRKIGIFLDRAIGEGRLAGIQAAIENLSRNDDPMLKKMFKDIVVHVGDVNETELEYMENYKKVSKDDLVIITDLVDYGCLEAYKDSSVITQIDGASLKGDAYFPFLEITMFALMRLPALGYTKADIISFYNSIPNVEKLGTHEILALCWDEERARPRNMVILKLVVPGAGALTADSVFYDKVADHINSRA